MTAETAGNRVALVTGSTKNTGRAIARALAEAGYSVAINARQASDAGHELVEDLTTAGRSAVLAVGDVSDRDHVVRMVGEIREALGPISCLVTAAAHRTHTPFHELTMSEWNATVATNLTGFYHCVQESLPDMIAQEFGRIIAVTGTSGHRWPTPVGDAHVAATKAGVEGMLRALAREYGRNGITANGVCPGPIDTGSPNARTAAVYRLASGAKTSMESVGAVCAFLSSDAAGSINGEVIVMDGGGPIFQDEGQG